jgi:hypothetical protein
VNTKAVGNFIERLNELATRIPLGAAAILPIGAASKEHG